MDTVLRLPEHTTRVATPRGKMIPTIHTCTNNVHNHIWEVIILTDTLTLEHITKLGGDEGDKNYIVVTSS